MLQLSYKLSISVGVLPQQRKDPSQQGSGFVVSCDQHGQHLVSDGVVVEPGVDQVLEEIMFHVIIPEGCRDGVSSYYERRISFLSLLHGKRNQSCGYKMPRIKSAIIFLLSCGLACSKK